MDLSFMNEGKSRIEELEEYFSKASNEEIEVFNDIYKELDREDEPEIRRFKALVLWAGKTEQDKKYNNELKIDTRIRGIESKTWELFKQYCREESVERNETVSANAMLKEMITKVVADYFK